MSITFGWFIGMVIGVVVECVAEAVAYWMQQFGSAFYWLQHPSSTIVGPVGAGLEVRRGLAWIGSSAWIPRVLLVVQWCPWSGKEQERCPSRRLLASTSSSLSCGEQLGAELVRPGGDTDFWVPVSSLHPVSTLSAVFPTSRQRVQNRQVLQSYVEREGQMMLHRSLWKMIFHRSCHRIAGVEIVQDVFVENHMPHFHAQCTDQDLFNDIINDTTNSCVSLSTRTLLNVGHGTHH